jgi:hypothetical protein
MIYRFYDTFEDLELEEVLFHPKLSDEFKYDFFKQLVEYDFRKWRINSIESSNVKKILYNEETEELTIQFQDKSIYTYFNIPLEMAREIWEGKAVCTTSGSNEYGEWEVGKTPSNGAAIWDYLRGRKITPEPKYKKGGSFR